MTTINLIKDILRQEHKKAQERQQRQIYDAYRAPIIGTQIKRR